MSRICQLNIAAALILLAFPACKGKEIPEVTSGFTVEAAFPELPFDGGRGWLPSDAITLLSDDGSAAVSSGREGNKFSFEGKEDGWTVALYANDAKGSPAGNVSLKKSVVTVEMSDNQTFAGGGDVIPTSGLVAVSQVGKTSGSSCSATLKAANAFLEFNLARYSTISSISLSSKESASLCGKVEINAETLETRMVEGSKVVGAGVSDGCFLKGDRTYCFCIVPGLSFTPVFTFRDNMGRTATYEWPSAVTFTKSKNHVLLEDIDKEIDLESSASMPDTLQLVIDPAWRFSREISPVQDPVKGETYSYLYTSADGYSAELPFVFCKGTGDDAQYSITESAQGKYLSFTKSGAWIKLPAIEGRHLEYVRLSLLNTLGKTFAVNLAPAGDAIYESGRFTGTRTARFNQRGNASTTDATSYYVTIPSGDNIMISEIQLTYVRESGGYIFDGKYYRDQPLTEWEKGVKSRADLFNDISWTPRAGTMPTQKKGQFFAMGTEYHGIPYSSHWNKGNGAAFLGLEVSFYTFLSSIENPASRMYTLDFHYIPTENDESNGAVYGSVCSTTVDYLLGYPCPYTTHQIFSSLVPSLNDVGTDWSGIQLYDAPTANNSDSVEEPELATGHAMMIYGIGRDADGKVQEVTVEEAWGAKLATFSAGTRRVTYTFDDFCKRMRELDYRNFRVDQDDFAYHLPACIEQDLTQINRSFPENVCFEYGDKSTVVMKKGQSDTTVTVNVLKLDSYTKIIVRKDGVEHLNKKVSAVGSQSFTLGEGLYEVCLSSSKGESRPTKFQIVADQYSRMSAKYTGGIIYLTVPDGFEPVCVAPNYCGHNIPCCGRDASGRYMFRFPEEWKDPKSSVIAIKMAGKYGVYKTSRGIYYNK